MMKGIFLYDERYIPRLRGFLESSGKWELCEATASWWMTSLLTSRTLPGPERSDKIDAYTYIYVYIYVYVHIYIYVCMSLVLKPHLCIHIVYACIYTHMYNGYTYACWHAHAYTYAYAYALYTHTGFRISTGL